MGGCQSKSAASGAKSPPSRASVSVVPTPDSAHQGTTTAPPPRAGSAKNRGHPSPTRTATSSSGRRPPKSPSKMMIASRRTADARRGAGSPAGGSSTTTPASSSAAISNGRRARSPKKIKAAVTTDARWKALYHAYKHKAIDPADVHSVVDALISKQINRLSPTEVTLLQRAVRHLGNALPPTASKLTMGQRLGLGGIITLNSGYNSKQSSSSNHGAQDAAPDTRTVRDRYHLLDENLVRKLWTFRNAPSCNEWQLRMENMGHEEIALDVDPIGAAYVLMLHLSLEALWDRVAKIAEESAAQVGLVLDVNHPKPKKDVPLPHKIQPSPRVETPPGVTFRDVCFLVAQALRGSRVQRLQLLFYLLLPPEDLMEFLASHPAGGIPSWLLEVDSGVVLSLGSLSHYYYFGTAFLPGPETTGIIPERKQKSSLAVSAMGAMETVANLLYMPHVDAPEATATPSSSSSPERRLSGPQSLLRSNSRHGDAPSLPSVSSSSSLVGDWSSAVGTRDSAVMEMLREIREGRKLTQADVALKDSARQFWEACEPHLSKTHERWTMDAFALWAEVAIDDAALDAIMHRLFAIGALPSPATEKELVTQRWKQWQQNDSRLWTLEEEAQDVVSYLSHSMQNVFQMKRGDSSHLSSLSLVWGGIGGFDGRGGLGQGIAYCIDKKWWDAWADYVGWEWDDQETVTQPTRKRPDELSTEVLLDRSSDSILAGTFGSYEIMKSGLVKGLDYVIIPTGVWDVLYELYGGGPPLPRMVLPPRIESRERTFSTDSKQMEEEDYMFAESSSVEVSPNPGKLRRIPDALVVSTHPWILHCHICDAQQPYRRGEAGPMSIRVMATPDQPLWRLYAEIIVRLPGLNVKALNKDGRGQARLWKRFDPTTGKDAMTRYGPWSLLCKNRTAILPSVANHRIEFEENYDTLKSNWQAYADHATVEGIGLTTGDRLMLEYAVLNKKGDFVWPREAAAKAGRARRLEEEDLKFRRTLKGVDEKESPLNPPPALVGMKVDAMDISGRWFQVEIIEVQFVEAEDEEDVDGENTEENLTPPNDKDSSTKEREKKHVRVDFSDFGGHPEWISVDSDRLAVAERFTMTDTGQQEVETKNNGKNASETKARSPSAPKKSNSDASDQIGGKICPFPGYGACGLANLGNTCYANSAIQCISYMPLLRAYLLSARYKANGDFNRDNPLGTGGKLLEEFAELLRIMWSGKYGERSPNRFRSCLGKARSQFSGADQQDAQEVLNYMLDVLHEDSNRVAKKPYVEALEDDWVKVNSLLRVGDEAWRRFLRRNRSIMADVAMGQVLNTVTCPVCNFSSRNFDPFNLLSIPFPTVADVVFQCIVIRRGTANNSSDILDRPKRGDKIRGRFSGKKVSDDPQPPSVQLIQEQYAVAMSRLADIGDLKLQLQNVCGIPSNQLKLYKLEEVLLDKEVADSSPVKKHLSVSILSDKEGSAGPHGTKITSLSDDVGTSEKTSTRIVAFETTLHPRPLRTNESLDDDEADTTEADDTSEEGDYDENYSEKESRLLKEHLRYYGDKVECRVFDTDPLPISKAISRSLWPTTAHEMKLGLRVDAIDHRDHWFPGSVVEIIEGVPSELDENPSDEEKADAVETKVRIHFDNFSSKWDETYTIDHFTRGQVRPLYSHATPRTRPTDFMVHHRFYDKRSKTNVLFGQAFFLQCHTEWSTARAGAHILAQAARFLHKPSDALADGPVDVDTVLEADGRVSRLYEKAQTAISDLIDLLVECDREYVRAALGIRDHGEVPENHKFRHSTFDATEISTALVKKVGTLLHRLPFEVRVCMADSPAGNKPGPTSEDSPFPFSLMRTIGNFMNARHAIALHWRDCRPDRKSKSKTIPIMYVPPPLVVHKSSATLLEDSESKTRKSKNSPGSGGLHLSVCLNEFCKEQQLGLSDCWRCPQCKEFREGRQNMNLWRLPDLLTFHIKRFNCSARWREKITTKVNFPLTGLDVSEWCHAEAPSLAAADGSYVYDLIGVLNHYGSMTGGHYVATCKATACSPEGSEEVAYSFQGTGANVVFGGKSDAGDVSGSGDDKPSWRLGGRKDKDATVQQLRAAAMAASRSVSGSAEPLWLQFDDDLVEPIPPRSVVSEMAYVLFYRRRRLTPCSVAKYSTLG